MLLYALEHLTQCIHTFKSTQQKKEYYIYIKFSLSVWLRCDRTTLTLHSCVIHTFFKCIDKHKKIQFIKFNLLVHLRCARALKTLCPFIYEYNDKYKKINVLNLTWGCVDYVLAYQWMWRSVPNIFDIF